MRWARSLVEFALDVVADVFVLRAPRKGESLIPPEQGPHVDALAPERERLANDLLNRGPCQCMDCVCGFNKTDPNYRPGRGQE